MGVNKTPFTIHIIGPFIKHDIGNSIYDECNISITCPWYPVHLDNMVMYLSWAFKVCWVGPYVRDVYTTEVRDGEGEGS